MLLTESEAKAICEKVLGFVKADDAEVMLNGENYSHLRFAANTFTTSGYREDAGVGVNVWIDQKKGSASGNGLDADSLQSLVKQAEEMARVSPVDEEYLPTIGRQTYKPTSGFVGATVGVALDERAKAIGAVIGECEKTKVVGAGFHQARGAVEASATKHGNFYYGRSSVASLAVTARTPDGTGSGYFRRNHFDVARLNTARVGHEAVQKALRSRQPKPLGPGVYTVILEPQAVADLLGTLRFAFDARRTDEGRGAFSAPGGKTRLGEQVTDERLSLLSDPWHPEVPGAAAAQDGIPAQKLYLVRKGVLENLVYSRFWAKKKEKEPTPGPVNTILESTAGPVGVEDMIRDTKRGLLISRFFYIRSTDPRTASSTGLTRDGIWYIEDGKIQHPVQNFRFNQSVIRMLAPGNVDLIGTPERVASSEGSRGAAMFLPSLKVKEFHLTSTSEAV